MKPNSAMPWYRRELARPGEQHPRHKLTDEAVLVARELARSGAGLDAIGDQIASRFGVVVGKSTLSMAIRGNNWSHLPNPVTDRLPLRKV